MCLIVRRAQPVTACHRARGFVFEPGSGQCTPVLWLHQGSGETVVPAGSVDTHFENTFLPNQLDEVCQDGFERGNVAVRDVSPSWRSMASSLNPVNLFANDSRADRCAAMRTADFNSLHTKVLVPRVQISVTEASLVSVTDRESQ
ncbi:hypothetical protein PoB_003621100 [Plakobranchus ocellatus]|uniref:Uncharacterized protein n=1 Tax=Plakobranchus ocellatus TaxID=259542 RepID=A0AAV4AT12_9GAST|nr:hypothetical protein PoB_003621100 [Plakobranchus ocellatus]